MNDKDEQIHHLLRNLNHACKVVSDFKEDKLSLIEHSKKLQDENKKLREALYHVRGMLLRTFGNPYVLGLDVLNEALKEVGEK